MKRPGLSRYARALLWVCCGCLLPTVSLAQTAGTEPVLTLSAPPPLTVGDRATVIARVRNNGRPLLLTPATEGEAVEVVRGRLLRSDAPDPDAETLELTIPIVARHAGTSVLRARLETFVCQPCERGAEGECDERCESVSVEAELSLEVRAAR